MVRNVLAHRNTCEPGLWPTPPILLVPFLFTSRMLAGVAVGSSSAWERGEEQEMGPGVLCDQLLRLE